MTTTVTNVPATLYRGKGCGSAMVEAAFALAGQPLTLIDASRWDGGDAFAELERLNPLGQVPTLAWPDGTVQTESAAILIELALRVPQAELLPSAPAERATALRWLIYLSAYLYSAFNPRDFPERWLSEEAQHEALIAGATGRIKGAWQVLEAQFAPRGPFAFGAAPGVLDVAIATMSRWTPQRAWFDRHCPRLAQLAHAADAWPALVPVWRANFDD